MKSEFLGPSIDNLKALGCRNAEEFPNQWDSSDKIGFIDSWLSYRPNLGRINIYWHMFFLPISMKFRIEKSGDHYLSIVHEKL